MNFCLHYERVSCETRNRELALVTIIPENWLKVIQLTPFDGVLCRFLLYELSTKNFIYLQIGWRRKYDLIKSIHFLINQYFKDLLSSEYRYKMFMIQWKLQNEIFLLKAMITMLKFDCNELSWKKKWVAKWKLSSGVNHESTTESAFR